MVGASIGRTDKVKLAFTKIGQNCFLFLMLFQGSVKFIL